MAKYIVFDIENEEPIKTSSTLMQSDNEFTRSYILGSSIRGAYISNYISIKKVKNINLGIHKEKLLKGGMKFFNAYPITEEGRSFPMPKCFYGTKDEIKKYNIKNKMKISFLNGSSKEDFERIKGFEFVKLNFTKETIETVKVKKINNLHIKKDSKNKLFRYEAINPNNKFRAMIKCEDESYVEEAKEILQRGLYYIGGSKGSGYGKCKIYNISIKDDNPEMVYFINQGDLQNDSFEESDTLYIYATSDIIFRDKLGIYKSYIDEDYIKRKLNLEEVTFKESFIDTEYFTGFNNKWGYKLPVVTGIKLGSILGYKFKGELNFEKIKAFVEEGIGERKQEGFGRFIILSDIEEQLYFSKLKGINEKEKSIKEILIQDQEKKDQLNTILNRIYLDKLDNMVITEVLKLNEKIRGELNLNQFGKLLNLMDILQGMKCDGGVKRLEEYFAHIEDKKINRDLAIVLKNVTIENKPIKDYLLDQLKDTNSKNFEDKYLHSIKIGGVQSKLENEIQAQYEYKVKIFKELFRLQLKSENKGERY